LTVLLHVQATSLQISSALLLSEFDVSGHRRRAT